MEQLSEILIGKDRKLTSDSHNIFLHLRRTNKKTGKDYWQTTNYFATIKEALHFLVEQGIRDSGLVNLDKKIDEIHAMIENIKIPVQYIEKATPTTPLDLSPEATRPLYRRLKRKTGEPVRRRL